MVGKMISFYSMIFFKGVTKESMEITQDLSLNNPYKPPLVVGGALRKHTMIFRKRQKGKVILPLYQSHRYKNDHVQKILFYSIISD